MHHTQLKAIGHNLADSLASGMGFMIGVFATDIYGEAAAGPPGYLEVDFLDATITGNAASAGLRRAVELYRQEALPELCRSHGVDPSTIRCLRARYSVDAVHGPQFTVTVGDSRGRQSEALYRGRPGKRVTRSTTAP